MRAAEKRHTYSLGLFSAGIPGSQEWHNFGGREMPWILEVRAQAGDFEAAEWIAHYVRRAAEVTFRIVGDRYFFTTGPVVFQPAVEGSLKGQYRLAPSDLPETPDWANYRLSVTDLSTLKKVHQGAFDAEDPRTRIALLRFRRGYGSGDDDALIDLWIGLEALFSDGAGEITYKAAMRIAHYVGRGAGDQRFLFRALKASYDVRSALVHGAHPASTTPARGVASHALAYRWLTCSPQTVY